MFFSRPVFAADLTGGNAVIDRVYNDSWSNFTLVDTNNPIAVNGILNTWSIWAKNLTKVQLKIFRLTGVDYTVVGESELVVLNAIGINTFNLTNPISVNKGDFVGLYFQDAGGVAFDLDSGGFSSGNLDGTVKFTNPGKNPHLGEVVHFDDSSNRTYSLSVGGTIKYIVDKDKIECPTADYTSIQAVVTALSDGDTIYVCKDSYNESVVVNKQNMTIVSIDGANFTTIEATKSGSSKFAFKLTKSGITIKGFTIKNADRIFGPSGIASAIILNKDNAIINNNIFEHNSYGIYSIGSNNNKITNNIFKNGIEIEGNGAAISLVGSANEISGNQIQDNDTEALIIGNNSTISKNNKITTNAIVGSGIILIRTNSNNITSNLIKNSKSNGILLSLTSKQNTIKTNSILGAKKDGISIETQATNNTIQNNMIKDSLGLDARDLTSPLKNAWILNMCLTSYPTSLCKFSSF